jgi:ABC-type branched-subunit amino acid transport system ATPase component
MIVVVIFAIITEMKQTGAIVLLVEQNVHGALAVADWVLGRKLRVGHLNAVCMKGPILHAFGFTKLDLRHVHRTRFV